MTAEQVVSYPILEDERLEHIDHSFGSRFRLQIEPLIYVLTAELAPGYTGENCQLYCLSNGGSFMAPIADETYAVVCPNGFTEVMTANALGITASLFAYSHLSHSGNEDLAQRCAEHYYLLRDYMIDHPEAGKILRATE